MLSKSTVCKAAFFMCLGISTSLFAVEPKPLHIMNNTKFDSTTRTNDSLLCSHRLLGQGGITRAGKSNTIEPWKLSLACGKKVHDCKADVYMTANCSGPIVATVIFSLENGVQKIMMHDKKFDITGIGTFNVTMNQVG